MNSTKYDYHVTWSVADNAYIGTVTEFPSLSWIADTPESALHGISDVVDQVLSDMQSSGEAAPQPLSLRTYSGKFMVRIPPELHRQLAIEAARQSVSLNRSILHKLASA